MCHERDRKIENGEEIEEGVYRVTRFSIKPISKWSILGNNEVERMIQKTKVSSAVVEYKVTAIRS